MSLEELQEMTDGVRAQVARFVNATPQEIAFLYATTEGENVVADALDLQAGENVVIDELHYKGTFVLYRYLEQSRGIQLRIVPHRDGAVGPEDFARYVDDRTRLVSVAFVSNRNGFRYDLQAIARLAHAHHAYFYVDAIQAFGMIPFDVRHTEIDFFTAGTYKWVFGGFGVAPFYVRAELIDRIRPARRGLQSVEQELPDNRFKVMQGIKKFESALLGYAEIHQLSAALTYLDRIGLEQIESHGVRLAERLRQGLVERGFQVLTPEGNRAAIVSFENPIDEDMAARALRARRVRVTIRENGSQVRVSPALFNTADEVDRFLDVAEDVFLRRSH